MNYNTLPYLASLRSSFASVEALASSDPGAAFQVAAAMRLLDYMTVQRGPAQGLKVRCFTALQSLLPEIAALLPEVNAVVELRAICASADPDNFARLLLLAGDLQRSLFAMGNPKAVALCKSIAGIERDYYQDVEAALHAQVESATAASKVVSGARNARDYDEKALLTFLREQFSDETDLGIKQSNIVSGGYSKFTVSITLENAKSLPTDIILRADASATYGGASTVEEYRLIKTLYENGVRVPRPIAVEETGKVFGSKFLIVEKKPGISVGHMYKLPQRNPSICSDLAKQLALIHQIPITAFGDRIDNLNGSSSDKARAWIAEGLAAWRPLRMPSPAFELAFDWLQKNADINDKVPRALVHGDVHLANILVHEDRISTILDWEFAHIGNPAYDLGYFYDQAVALDSWEAFLDAYAEAGGQVPDQQQLDYAILFAATRLGVMTFQSMHEFVCGAKPGLAGAVVIGSSFHENSVKRITRVLERVL